MTKIFFKKTGMMLLTAIGLPVIIFAQQKNTDKKEMKTQMFEMHISKTVEVPLENVWNAWSNAESIRKWWGPEGFTAPVAKPDFREGGISLVCMRSPDGFSIYNSWTYKKIMPMFGFDFVQHFADSNGNKIKPADLGLPAGIPDEVPHSIRFKDKGNNQTEIIIIEYGYTSADVAEMSKAGMNQVLDKLSKFLEADYDKSNDNIIQQTIKIRATSSEVWKVISHPKHMKAWLGGANVTSDWKEGSPIQFSGKWNEKEYTDKGVVLQYEPEKRFQYSYWSTFSGLPDSPENYSIIRFDIIPVTPSETKIALVHQNFATKKMYEHSAVNWKETFDLIKKIAEEKKDN